MVKKAVTTSTVPACKDCQFKNEIIENLKNEMRDLTFKYEAIKNTKVGEKPEKAPMTKEQQDAFEAKKQERIKQKLEKLEDIKNTKAENQKLKKELLTRFGVTI